jgi:hypothetical protein
MHDMEHESNALHSATDAVFTKGVLPVSDSIGGLDLQGTGELRLFRTKLYLFYENGRLTKKARHGFHGSVDQLEKLWEFRANSYKYRKIPTVGEYFLHKKLNLRLFGMNEYKARINIDWNVLD